MESNFPILDLYSLPLLIIYLQGLLFCVLLVKKGYQQQATDYLLIAVLLFAVVFHYLPQLLTFMGWYMTSFNTRSNYFLISTGLLTGPLIYLYLKKALGQNAAINVSSWIHFGPFLIFLVYRLVLLASDIQSEDWSQEMEGPLQREFHMKWVLPLLSLLEYSSQLIYLAFSIQMFLRYRQLMAVHFGTIEKAAMNWLSSFLIAYSTLFVIQTVIDLLDATVTPVSYQSLWLIQFGHASSVLYFGIRAYFTDTSLLKVEKSIISSRHDLVPIKEIDQVLVNKIQNTMLNEKLFLNAELTLSTFSEELRRPAGEISAAINGGFQKNFNEWVNTFRVDEVKRKLEDPATSHYSLLAIAMDCGFNSKASFNRVFRQIEGLSPSEFRSSQKK